MNGAVPWIVACYTADESPPATTAARLTSWLADQPGVELHTVLWAKGYRGTDAYDRGRLADVASARDRFVPNTLRRVGLGRLGGGLLSGKARLGSMAVRR